MKSKSLISFVEKFRKTSTVRTQLDLRETSAKIIFYMHEKFILPRQEHMKRNVRIASIYICYGELAAFPSGNKKRL